ncbi:ATP-binding protein [Lachnospiraceae bacterium Oil+RF-744-WCA-WT-11]|uniref:ATP-binding protein n=1 Tax=Porcincola intestinalis TaxID=2606632 RepID=A0A6L5X350_9FIRM|nr:ATP-binding protein [Porcincola intestinalis]MSS13957.1 ATP-binding protein [Porcincola intestinalis]
MKRNLMKSLKEWKNSPYRKPLILSGARQVGKTWLMKEFGRTEYANIVYVNFDQDINAAGLFEGSINPDRIILGLRALSGMEIDPDNTLIIFDEVQEAPRALTSLKYFCEEAPQYSIIAAGSLLGVALHAGTSFPVGKVDRMHLYPLNFQEFLYAMGEDAAAEILQTKDQRMITVLREKLSDLLRQHYYVGGMPEAVNYYKDNKEFTGVRQIQKNLLAYYQQDFSKHAEPRLTERLNLVWSSIPVQLAKENRKFIYGQIRQGARAKDFELAIQWLSDCGLIHVIHRVTKPGYPLKAYEDLNAFKIYLLDVGLLGAMADLSSNTIVEGNRIFTEFKGALAEQYVLQELIAEDHLNPMYYSAENSRMEIDFIVQKGDEVIPIEVKAEENLRAKSLRSYCEKYKPKTAVRFSMSDYREQDWMVNVPLYEINWLIEQGKDSEMKWHS